MQKTLHPRDDMDRLYVSRKEGYSRYIDKTAQRLDKSK